MALDRLTKVDGGGISTTSDYRVGVITATKFVGPVEGSLTGAINATSANFTGNVTIGGTLTYEDVTNIDSIGLGTFRNGIHVKTGTATTALVVEGDGRVTGILTIGTSSLTLDGTNNLVNVGTALTLGHTQGVQFHTQNLHSQGFEVNNINASGIITAAQFSGDGSNLANLPAGLGTALSSTQSSPLNKIYYTNTVLPIDTTTTVDPPASASAAYTQYTDISIATGADLIISDGDDLIPDVLGLRPDGTLGGGSLGRIRVDKLVGKNANSAVNVEKGLVITGITTIKNTAGIKLYEGSGNESKLFHSGEEKLSTQANGVKVQDTTATGAYLTITTSAGSQGSLYGTSNSLGFLDSQNHYMIKGVKDGTVELYFDNSKKLETVTGGVNVTGALVASGDVTAFSDLRLKTDIHTIKDALDIVGNLRGVAYKWLNNGKSSIGVIAQEVEQVLPEIVTTNKDLIFDGAKDVKSIDYGKIVSVLINAINELKAELDEMKGGE